MALYKKNQVVALPTVRPIAGHASDNTLRTFTVDAAGHLQIDVLTSPNNYVDVNEHVADAATDASAVILTYDPPAGKTAVILAVSKFDTAGNTAVVDVRLNNGTTTLVVERWAAAENGIKIIDIALEDGHSLELFVSTAGALNDTADVTISATEQA